VKRMALSRERTFRKPFTMVHAVTAGQASSGIVPLAIGTIASGTGLAYDYWTRTSAGLGRVTAYTSNFIQSSGILFISGTFATGDIVTAHCQLMFV
jgi:hypothetical protein